MLSGISEFIPPSGLHTSPDGITAGPGGSLWFTEENADQIGVINAANQKMSEYPVPTAGAEPFRITVGSDGNLWFTELNADKIGMLNPGTGKISEFPVPTADAQPFEIAAGRDGTIWFTEWGANQIGMLSIASGKITEFPVPTFDGVPEGIAIGSDGNIWFTEGVADKLGVLSATTHTITEPVALPAGSSPDGITTGPGGALWFTEPGTNQVGTFDPATGVLQQFGIPTAGSKPAEVTAGLDGNIWFTEWGTSQVGMLNPATGAIAELSPATVGSGPRGITTGPDGNIWFAELGAGKVGVVANTHVVLMSGVPSNLTAGATFGLTAQVEFESGVIDTGYTGSLTIAEAAGPSGSALAGTTTIAVTSGIANFGGLSMTSAGSYTLAVTGGTAAAAVVGPVEVASAMGPGPQSNAPPTSSSASATLPAAPTIVGERVLTAGKGKRRHIVGFTLVFSEPLNAASAGNSANYSIVQTLSRTRAKIARQVRFHAAYNALGNSVSLMVAGKPRFARGGELVVKASPTSGISSTSGTFLDGTDAGTAGTDGVFTILASGRGIVR
jgi:virginiamycin B lyase